jgi:hypothetical protein
MNKPNQATLVGPWCEEKMQNRTRLAAIGLVLGISLLALPSITPRAYAANIANPCLQKCGILLLSPGGALNTNKTVNPSFMVSFAVFNFTLVQPGTINDVNTVTTASPGNPAHNEGHIHVWVDGAYVEIWANTNGIPLTLTPGSHTIRLDLVNDLHYQFSPGINVTTTVNVLDSTAPLQSTANNAQNNASNAMYYSLGALIVAIISVILVAYVAFKPKSKGM